MLLNIERFPNRWKLFNGLGGALFSLGLQDLTLKQLSTLTPEELRHKLNDGHNTKISYLSSDERDKAVDLLLDYMYKQKGNATFILLEVIVVPLRPVYSITELRIVLTLSMLFFQRKEIKRLKKQRKHQMTPETNSHRRQTVLQKLALVRTLQLFMYTDDNMTYI